MSQAAAWRRHLAALVAVFAPERTERLIALVSASASDGFQEHAVALARCTREERLAALAEAFSSTSRVKAARPGPGMSLWERLAGEAALARDARPFHPSAPRTDVRHQDGAARWSPERSSGNASPPGGMVHEDALHR
jgi:hypothetical protein